MSESPYAEAQRLLSGAGTWHEFRASLTERALDLQLGAADLDDLRMQWLARQASHLTDDALVRELKFWSDGGSYDQHLDGYKAINPGTLLDQAEQRGWFVRRLASGAVVNAPDGKPLMLKGLDVINPAPDGP